MEYIYILLKNILILVPVLVIVALMSLLERKIIGGVQRRKGPNVVGVFGLLQPIADAAKLFGKETILPNVSNKIIFLLSPVSLMVLSVISFSVLPFGYAKVVSDVVMGILVLLVISSIGVYGIIMAGWSSNSKYAFLGGLRSAAQMIAYEVGIGIYLLLGCCLCNSLNLTEIVLNQENIWLIIPLHMVGFLFFISALAETNRSPFDLPEAEAELVSGYNVEYSSMTFALFFIAEYGMILVMSMMVVIVFLGGWSFNGLLGGIIYGLKVVFIISLFVLVRAALPRCRYDQLMRLGWKVLLPLALGFIVLVSGIFVYVLGNSNVGYIHIIEMFDIFSKVK